MIAMKGRLKCAFLSNELAGPSVLRQGKQEGGAT